LNVRDAHSALATQLSGMHAVAEILATWPAMWVFGTVSVLLTAYWLKGKSVADLRSFVLEERHLLLFGLVGFFHLLTLVVARTVYRWGALVDESYLSPVCWVVPFLLLAVCLSLGPRLGLRQETIVVLLVLALSVNASLQIRRQFRLRSWHTTHFPEWVSAADLIDLSREIDSDTFVLCDHAGVLMTRTGLDMRYPAKVEGDRVVDGELLNPENLRRAGDNGWLWGILATDVEAFRRGRYGPLLQDLVAEPGRFPEFHARELSNGTLILQYVGATRKHGALTHAAQQDHSEASQPIR